MKEIYHNLKNYMLTALLVLSSSACGSHGNEQSGTDNSDTPAPSKTSFTQGADISWVSEMEKKGLKFYNHEGIETDCFQLMKELGINAIRLRVWVNPKDRWNGKQDVVNKARRAKEQGLDVMVDFHYSDSWANPGQQFKPKAWIGKSVAELKTAIAAHTIDILQALKAEDISPRWVQVGNEIRPGMLWDENVALSGAFYDIRECDVKGLNSTNERVKYPQNTQNLAEFVNTGYDAVKKIFPQSIVIVHIDNAWDDLTWWFKQFKEAGGKLDMIGLSHYPQTHSTKLWQEMNLLALKHISQLAKTFQVKVMITEIGVKQNDSASAQVLADFINKARDMESCAGVWYWEPECYEWNGYDMGAFDKNGKPTAIMNAFQSSTKRK